MTELRRLIGIWGGTEPGLVAISDNSFEKQDCTSRACLSIVAAGFPLFWLWRRCTASRYKAPPKGEDP
jgi:hypothetical protein